MGTSEPIKQKKYWGVGSSRGVAILQVEVSIAPPPPPPHPPTLLIRCKIITGYSSTFSEKQITGPALIYTVGTQPKDDPGCTQTLNLLIYPLHHSTIGYTKAILHPHNFTYTYLYTTDAPPPATMVHMRPLLFRIVSLREAPLLASSSAMYAS